MYFKYVLLILFWNHVWAYTKFPLDLILNLEAAAVTPAQDWNRYSLLKNRISTVLLQLSFIYLLHNIPIIKNILFWKSQIIFTAIYFILFFSSTQYILLFLRRNSNIFYTASEERKNLLTWGKRIKEKQKRKAKITTHWQGRGITLNFRGGAFPT